MIQLILIFALSAALPELNHSVFGRMELSEDLEEQYSTNRWSKRYSSEEILDKHMEFVTNASKEAKKTIPCELDVAYGPSDSEKMDIFGTDLPQNSPLFIYVHGGYWQKLSRNISSYMVAPLYKNKFKVIIVGYTLCPKVSLTEIVYQIQRAFLKSLDYAETFKSRAIYLCGHSAGAHLIASLFQEFMGALGERAYKKIKAVYLISGVYDIIPLIHTTINDAIQLNFASAKKLSPMHQNFVANKIIRFFCFVGENESPAFHNQSEVFNKKLLENGYKSDFLVVKNVDHFDIVEKLNDENYEVMKLFIKMNKNNNV